MACVHHDTLNLKYSKSRGVSRVYSHKTATLEKKAWFHDLLRYTVMTMSEAEDIGQPDQHPYALTTSVLLTYVLIVLTQNIELIQRGTTY